jgi:hypothetical protein
MPQAPGNNQGPWEGLESFSRTLVGQGNELYIVMGGTGSGGTGANGGITHTLANGQVTVPAYTWKVIIILPNGDNDVSRVNNNTRTIAVIMPNRNNILNDPWQKYLATVDQVEALTGYDFFSNVNGAVQNVIESRLDPASNTSPQTLAGGTYTNLDITAPNTTLSGNVTVTGTLNLGGSILNTGGSKITFAPGATISRVSGYVIGQVEKQFDDPNAPNFEYPTGTQNGYSPVTVDLTALGSIPSSLTISAVQNPHPAAPTPERALRRYWNLEETGDLTVNITFKYLDVDVPATVPDENDFRLYRYETDFTQIGAILDPAANTMTANNISQFSAWTLLAVGPSAASVTIGGRILSATGRGVQNARVYLTDSNGETRFVNTNPFGYYRFTEVPVGETFVLNVFNKRYNYEPRVITVNEALENLDFTAIP